MRPIKNLCYRQGDVMLVACKQPEAVLIRKDNVLAYGEVTGHKHQFLAPTVEVYITATGQQYCYVPQEAILTHEEHASQTIQPAWYEVRVQRELDLLQQIRQVAD